MTDYTPAKDRLLVALAEWWATGTGKGWKASMDRAARDVLSEKKDMGPPDETMRLALAESELAELKRRVERALDYANGNVPASEYRRIQGILEGKEKP